MYTYKNYKTKKAMIEDFKAGVKISVYQAGGMFPGANSGRVSLEGPHYPAAHTWYASAVIENEIVISVK
jgi:hypothetical protein